MAIQDINIGSLANDGTGDDLRTAMQKINSNFDELDLRNDEATTATNVGTGGNEVFKQKVGYNLQFRKIIQGDRIQVTTVGDLITVAFSGTGTTFTTDGGSSVVGDGGTLTVVGGAGISTSATGSTITITNDSGSLGFEQNLDFGSINQIVDSHRDFLQYFVDVDYGTILAPTGITTNLGTI